MAGCFLYKGAAEESPEYKEAAESHANDLVVFRNFATRRPYEIVPVSKALVISGLYHITIVLGK